MEKNNFVVVVVVVESNDLYIGLGLVLSFSIFTGRSFILKKKAVCDLPRKGL